jgi:hypothetical protein
MPMNTRGTVRASKAYAVFRLIFGFVLAGIGISQYQRGGAYVHAAMVSLILGALFIGYGFFALLFRKKIGSQFEVEISTPTERLLELDKMKQGGLISETEYAAKRQEILKDL